jgi:hypothetical protein
MVSPAKTGAGNWTSEMATCAMIVPGVSSATGSPATSAAVNMLFTSGRPNSLRAAYSVSRCIGAGFMVIRGEQHVAGLGDRPPGHVLHVGPHRKLLEPAPGDRPPCRVLALPEIHASPRRFWFEILTGTRRRFTYLA